ncbi:MAG: DUF3467 domain-containing protein [Candidatus Nealsonbacteria bacterium CG_4_9_14_3_um_filter_35_11]|uniref:DUF3467 domain-containing protein n=2 Tax=Candidatus Nealsoniibacteriota TaxID=1817911 RepID=A0A2M7DB92_9BACT|nr:MAG: hypothetical protein COV62_01975 [Candidatus Nealsonbacteria bacterium CG11_big_fil_rev_8_21_14_0_20_35_11]PIV45716.1 MAG: DUF3467 domain-containing protein [Candidatus Nealsonbacteria bacterium CG02_land_8_20_14_3_00_34_20]PIW92744.1 MAG: DUF3467 domain-containing protein [Candidatus Nealsonbacteria bacterium CG_4_8_14_3_um_filter_34_13]PJA84323.1 MAG: DUF3467 domain-containing protein [Candidatus Nealsonbacteria bacterium CG_4_9_14_3_um_filter_35_11]
MDQQPKQIQIKIADSELKGSYANLMRVSHTKEEFILDFANVLPQEGGIVTARIITSPGHLKRIIQALQGNLKRYEENFGEIEIAKEPNSQIGFKP